MRDTSLDEFIGGDAADVDEDERAGSEEERGDVESERTGLEDEQADSEEGTSPDEDEREDVEDEGGDAVRSAVSTSDWTPGGASCAGCGEVVERRWRDDGELVCADCKRW